MTAIIAMKAKQTHQDEVVMFDADAKAIRIDNCASYCISNDKKEGIVSLTVVEGDALVAAQVARATEQILQDWIIEYKIKNAKAQYDFIEKQFLELLENADDSTDLAAELTRAKNEYALLEQKFIEAEAQRG